MLSVTAIRSAMRSFARDYPIAYIGLFGSRARQSNLRASDIDLLVRFYHPIDFFAFVELERKMTRRLGKKVDLVTEKGLKKGIQPFVHNDLVTLYERRSRSRQPHPGSH